MSKGVYTQLIAPNGAKIKVRDFKAWSEEIRMKLVFRKPVLIKLDKHPFNATSQTGS